MLLWILWISCSAALPLLAQVRTYQDDTTYHFHQSEAHWRLDHELLNAYRSQDDEACVAFLDTIIRQGFFNNGHGQHDFIGVLCLDRMKKTERVITLLQQIRWSDKDYFCDAPLDRRKLLSSRIRQDSRFKALCPDYPKHIGRDDAKSRHASQFIPLIKPIRRQPPAPNASNRTIDRSLQTLAILHIADQLEHEGYPSRSSYPSNELHQELFRFFYSIEDPMFIRKYLSDLQGSLRPQRYAMLLDHLSVLEHRPQTFGTQWSTSNGIKHLYPIADLTDCDHLRMRVGLSPLELFTTPRGILMPE